MAEELLEEILESGSSRKDGAKKDRKPMKKKKKSLKVAAILLAVLLVIECAYCVVIFTDWISPVAYLRQMYIETAMSTMNHQWLAKAFIPGDIVQAVVDQMQAAQESQIGVNSQWGDAQDQTGEQGSPSSGFSKEAAAELLSQLAQDVGLADESSEFFELFYELDEESVRAYAAEHPQVIANGWSNFYVHEAGLDDEGTSMVTTCGDQVLAVDAANGLMVVRITGASYRGVLVIGKDPSRLKCAAASNWGTVGERVGTIAQKNNGLVAITGSGFGDAEEVLEGADQSGASMCSGVTYGEHYSWGYKRIELRTDNRLYVVDANTKFSADCTDATEWTPALIVDGKNVAGEDRVYTALNPRACLGQTLDGSILMLGIEGRYVDSVGCNAAECADILSRYGAYQAMNLDGGTSAIVWYQGEYIMRCSNSSTPEGRHLPNAWVYCADTVED